MTEQVERPAYLIRKYGGYYRPNSQGYTSSAILAGRYTLAEAESITHPNGLKGPRDGMTYIHEDEVMDEDWQAFRAALTVTPQQAAKVLLDRWLVGEFENTADAAADDAYEAGNDSITITETWLRAISEDSHE